MGAFLLACSFAVFFTVIFWAISVEKKNLVPLKKTSMDYGIFAWRSDAPHRGIRHTSSMRKNTPPDSLNIKEYTPNTRNPYKIQSNKSDEFRKL